MSQDDLLLYYERELTYLRKLGAEFAQQYPKVASRLQLEAARCEDPHVERLLEGFAFLTARLQRRLDDDFPEISESLLEMLHPQLVRPVPSMCIAGIALDPAQGRSPEGFHIPRGSILHTRPINGMPCIFRTAYDTTLYPLQVSSSEWTTPDRAGAGTHGRDAVGAIRVGLQGFDGVPLESLAMPSLRFHLTGDSSVVDTLYELLVNNSVRITVRNPDRPSAPPVVLDPTALQPVGFGSNEGMLPSPNRSFAGFSLLQELFAFPEKFHFFDLVGLGDALRATGATTRADIGFLISSFERAERRQALELALSENTFKLGCTPAVNLFSQTAEPILLTERQFDHPVIPDARRRLEIDVWSVDEVQLIEHAGRTARRVSPLYSHKHQASRNEKADDQIFWHSIRRSAAWRTDRGTDVFLSFSDLSGQLRLPDQDVASVSVTCSNGDLPGKLPFGTDERGDFELVSGGPIQRITAVVNPTRSIQPTLGKSLLWRLISTLSLNHLSLMEGNGDALRELLHLHNVGNGLSAERQIDGLVGVQSEPAFSRVVAPHGMTFARGRHINLEFDEDQFPGGGAFIFASVLERFFALYATMNSFTRVSVRSRQRRRPMAEWPARVGWRVLV